MQLLWRLRGILDVRLVRNFAISQNRSGFRQKRQIQHNKSTKQMVKHVIQRFPKFLPYGGERGIEDFGSLRIKYSSIIGSTANL